MVHAATHVENDTVSEMEVASCSKDEVKKKRVLDGVILDQIFETNKPKINAELRVTMGEL